VKRIRGAVASLGSAALTPRLHRCHVAAMKILIVSLTAALSLACYADEFKPVDMMARVPAAKGLAVFKISDDEVVVNGSLLKRIEMGEKTMVLNYKSKLGKSVFPKFSIRIYNGYGMLLDTTRVSWTFSSVEPGAVKQENVSFSPTNLPSALSFSTVGLPKDWDRPVFLIVEGEVF
jgi:hypothetical protein